MFEYSSTGINNLKPGKLKYLLSIDNKCPCCTKELFIDSKSLNGVNIDIRFICCNCGFVCPIYHSINDPNIKSPIYNSNIGDFIISLGDTINTKRLRMINNENNIF